jgi:hypothetical protein
MPEQIWHKEVGAPEPRIAEPLEGYALTPQAFSTSNLVLGPVLHHTLWPASFVALYLHFIPDRPLPSVNLIGQPLDDVVVPA